MEVNHVMNPTFPLDAFLFKTIFELLTADKIDNSELFASLKSSLYKIIDEILPHLEDGRLESLIVVIQYFKAIRWNGHIGQTSVQSNFKISKLHINAELKEVVGFRDRLLKGAPSNAS
ncbi:hypothetical protein Ahy_A03g013725 isoform A [Arachis hypogaea]|uniref:Uncharacterized protein n=1 Tax=Arachis hypogaea TaxID=3818 RepID=A0A445DW63_ARAHY|nr:hypothetical protein Ahy_A03g013725 isoform A [Arachis hypogaea]